MGCGKEWRWTEAHSEDCWWYWPLQEQKITFVCLATMSIPSLVLPMYLQCIVNEWAVPDDFYSHLAPPSLASMSSLHQLQKSFPSPLSLLSPQQPWAQQTSLSFWKVPSLFHDFCDLHYCLSSPSVPSWCLLVTPCPFHTSQSWASPGVNSGPLVFALYIGL